MGNAANAGPATNGKRFCVQVLLFNVDASILQMLDNCAPFVEKIYATWSEYPWQYNAEAREKYRNPTRPEILDASKWRDRIELIRGEWDTEEAQRNAALERARADGMDFMIVQDADEFYTPDAYRENIAGIVANPDVTWYSVPWCIYWKTIDWCVTGANGSLVVGRPQFALNCRDVSATFAEKRSIAGSQGVHALPGLCHHVSYVMDDQSMLTKIETWGHSAEFDRQRWYADKWLGWTQETRNLHPVSPHAWPGVVRAPALRPRQISELPVPPVSMGRRRIGGGLRDAFADACDPARARRRVRRTGKRVLGALRSVADHAGDVMGALQRFAGHFTWRAKATACQRSNGGDLVLHIGCGSSRKPGMLNCELRSTPAVDVAMDCGDLSRFRTNSVKAIYSHAFFEHLFVEQRLPMLADSARILRNDGCLVFIGLPDFQVIAQAYLDGTPLAEGQPFDLHMVYRYTHGAPESTAPHWWMAQLHKGLLDRVSLRDMLMASGFGGGVLFNYRYLNEDVPLCLGVVAWKAVRPDGFDLTKLLAPFSDSILSIDDVTRSARYF